MTDVTTPQKVLYCDACGMPPEYCAYGPDFETHCVPWFKGNHPRLYQKLRAGWERDLNRTPGSKTPTPAAASGDADAAGADDPAPPTVTAPWTTAERLAAFYAKYAPDKVDGVDAMLEKYAGKEDKLFAALVKKYGEEPEDPFYADVGAATEAMEDLAVACKGAGGAKDKKTRRGAAAKTVNKVDTRVVVQKISRNRKKAVTHVVGMDTVPGVKLKEAAKAFSKRFAGSSSVKDKEIIIQGDHLEDVAEMIVNKFGASADSVFLDLDGEFVCYG